MTAGTFLSGKLFIGRHQMEGGRIGEPASYGLTEQLVERGLTTDRMKTGTPPRIDISSVDVSKLPLQLGDPDPARFSFLPEPSAVQGEVREPYASAIRNINSARERGSRVISADINSGMNGDDGSGALVVQSDLTVTIGLMKTGFFTEAGKTHYKELTLAEIGII